MGNLHPDRPTHPAPLLLKTSPLTLTVAGAATLAIALLLPVRFHALEEKVLLAAGKGTPSLPEMAASLLNSEHLGAGLRIALLAQSMDIPGGSGTTASAQAILSSRRDLAWLGTRDPRLEQVLATSGLAFEKNVTAPPAILTLLLREPVRIRLRQTLKANPSPGVQSLLNTLDLRPLPPLLPANQPGGQPLEAVTLLAAHLLDTAAFSPPLQPALLCLLSLARRFDYDSLRELVAGVESLATLDWLAGQVRSPAEPGDLLLAATLWAGPADRFTRLPESAKNPWAVLSSSLAAGRGSLELLIQRRCPVFSNPVSVPPALLPWLLLWEKPLLLLRALLFLLASWFLVKALWSILHATSPQTPGPWRPAPVFAQAILLALLLGTLPEPSVTQPKPLPNYRLSLALPGSPVKIEGSPRFSMEPTNLIALILFLATQIAVYRICVRRIRQIETGPGDPALKLRLLENDDNLFDSGLYVGIGGTAIALVLQVLGVIQPSLLAAYSSNLFGITCVAVIKIFHVRACKQRLLLPPAKT
ncbi:MAG: hypothetical protein EBT68_02665 [Verrucomicrobia bacterium]|nr:hypothetical protein [Verrucomicrobiota bacterium]